MIGRFSVRGLRGAAMLFVLAGAVLGCKKKLALVDADPAPSASPSASAIVADTKPAPSAEPAASAPAPVPVQGTPDPGGVQHLPLPALFASGKPAASTPAPTAAKTPGATKPTATAPSPGTGGNKYPPTCAGTCEYALRCAGAYNATEQSSCVAECRKKGEDPNKLSQFNAMSCPQIVAMLKSNGGGGSSSSSSSGGAGNGCSAAECSGCYWEQDMCLYVHGYIATGVKKGCKACCCPGH